MLVVVVGLMISLTTAGWRVEGGGGGGGLVPRREELSVMVYAVPLL